MSAPIDLFRRHIAAVEAGDLDADEALFDPDVETVTPVARSTAGRSSAP
jgi:ketosteroid isomerase-like protein